MLRGRSRLKSKVAALVGFFAVAATVASPVPAASALPTNFSDQSVISGLSLPTSLAFAPDGRVFVAEKSGLIKVFSSLDDPSPIVFADLRTETYNSGDQGLLGLVLDPSFPARPYLYVSYTYDAEIGGQAPKWGTPDHNTDPCPTPPGPIDDGCVASGRLSRLTATGNTMSSEKVLVNDWCQQYWGHANDDVAFGADGALYMSAGDGAAYNFADYGQRGDPLNPCGDPPAGVGGIMSPPTAEGGALRSQDYRTPGDPLGLDGTVIRVNPDTGRPIPDVPSSASPSAVNQARVVAYGFRNPYRIAVRPGTNEVWAGDVGWSRWDEINRIEPGAAAPRDYGWPCMEGGTLRPRSYETLDLNICNDFYAAGDGAGPYFSYQHGVPIVAGENCDVENGSAITGLGFYEAKGGASAFPPSYDGSLFFADYARGCIWQMPAGTDGLPDPSRVTNFGRGAQPVDLEQGPDGALYYPSIVDGQIHRISYSTGSNDSPPKPKIDSPAVGSLFSAGERFRFSGSATDDEDGTLPGSSLTWRLTYTKCGETLCTEFHLDLDADGKGGEFVSPREATARDLRLELTAVDSSGQATTVTRKLSPLQVQAVLTSKRVGARVSIDGVKGRTPFELGVLKGSAMLIATPLRQKAPGRGRRATLVWKRWSDGGGRVQYVSATRDRTLSAGYKLRKSRARHGR